MTKKNELLSALRDADLEASGLGDARVIKKLQIGPMLSLEQTHAQTNIAHAVMYELPYFDLGGRRIDYSRWKLFATKGELPLKYYQREKTIPRLYLPPLINWSKIAADTAQRIVITEGEKKAACGCLHGLSTIGVGGVWSWRAARWWLDTVKDFDLIKWTGREVEICFDGDLYSNEDVARALAAFTQRLTEKYGAKVFIRYLENRDGKSKLDDFLVAHGREGYEQLRVSEADHSQQLAALNDDLVYLKETKSYYSTCEDVRYANEEQLMRRYGDIALPTGDGRTTPAVKVWMRWPHRRMVQGVTYEPGRALFVDDHHNMWRPSGVEPRRGDVRPMLDVIADYGDPEFRGWFMQWLAYPLQHQGAKLMQAVVLWSPEEGTGKSQVGYVMCDIYGDNAEVIDSTDLYDERNTWMRNRQFVLGEEITKSNDRRTADRLKHLVTGEVIRINEKYEPAYRIPNKANFLFTSNHPDPVYFEQHDRRYGVAQVVSTKDEAFWKKFAEWRANGGPAAFLYHLKHDVDLEGFNPKAAPPMTHDKSVMIEANTSELDKWCIDLLADPDVMLGQVAIAAPGKDVFAVAELHAVLPEELKETTIQALGRSLAKAGAVRAGVVKTEKGSKRLVAVRNRDHWRKHLHKHMQWAANYVGELAVMKNRERGR